MDCLDKVEQDFYDGAVIPDTLMRCVSTNCQLRGINVDDEYVISYGKCTDFLDMKIYAESNAFKNFHKYRSVFSVVNEKISFEYNKE